MTETPYFACSILSASLHAARPAFVAAYTERVGRAASAQWLLMLIMRPGNIKIKLNVIKLFKYGNLWYFDINILENSKGEQ